MEMRGDSAKHPLGYDKRMYGRKEEGSEAL